jgi:hypothetical protein
MIGKGGPMAAAAQTDIDELAGWIPGNEAAALLRVTERSVRRRAEQGLIRRRTDPRPRVGKGIAAPLYSRADVEALLAGTPNMQAVLVREKQGSEDRAKTGKVVDDPNPLGAALVEALRAFTGARVDLVAAPSQNFRPWLPLTQASDYSGLPRRWLKAAARDGRVEAINAGTEKRPRWMYRLDALTGPLR